MGPTIARPPWARARAALLRAHQSCAPYAIVRTAASTDGKPGGSVLTTGAMLVASRTRTSNPTPLKQAPMNEAPDRIRTAPGVMATGYSRGSHDNSSVRRGIASRAAGWGRSRHNVRSGDSTVPRRPRTCRQPRARRRPCRTLTPRSRSECRRSRRKTAILRRQRRHRRGRARVLGIAENVIAPPGLGFQVRRRLLPFPPTATTVPSPEIDSGPPSPSIAPGIASPSGNPTRCSAPPALISTLAPSGMNASGSAVRPGAGRAARR